MNRAVMLERTGGPEVMEWWNLSEATPAAGELLVRHTAIGVNFVDTYQRSGLYPLELPSRLGQEAVGVVEEVGSGVQGFEVGDRVAYVSRLGAYAEYNLVPSARVLSVPSECRVDDTTLAASMLKGMTVEYLIRRVYPVKPGQSVLWHAAAGGTGLLACQWLRALGVRVIATVGSDEKAALALEHGASEVIVYTRENFVERVRVLTSGELLPVVFDSVGQETFLGSLDCLGPRGTMVSFGNASGKPSLPDVTLLARKGSLFLTRPTLDSYTQGPGELRESAAEVFRVLGSGSVRPLVGQTFPLAEVAAAHRVLESRQSRGSTVLLP